MEGAPTVEAKEQELITKHLGS
jgi:hypothetical protein